jgi:tRNA(Ile)-lysidine synthase
MPPLPDDAVERFRRDCEALAGPAPRRLGVAVSGGPDSLALLLLANAAFPGEVAAATIDHRLRPESASEARFVAGLCADFLVPHEIVPVTVDPARSSVQRAAREARYAALADWCGRHELLWLATAHHQDDQAETVLMRLMRGSGVSGLAGIRATTALESSEARLIRPLLGWRRDALGDLVRNAGLTAVSDPSNVDESYDRARLRRRLSALEWLDPAALSRSAAALAEAEQALAWAAGRIWDERVSREEETILFDARGLPAELVRRILVRLLDGAAPRGEEVQRLASALAGGGAATLGGYRCRGGPVWRFEPEGPRKIRGRTRP